MNEPDRPSVSAGLGGTGRGLERTDSLEERFDLDVVGRSVVESVLWDIGREEEGSCETERLVLRFARIWAQ